ncbi:CDGSH iron-sulfur domain-containing protein 3, mitochondrial-like [Uloborus diversus]|uniref:CDGSH iron-sulfur domain-containing protein 3, mitochondrial-like n=1 Tax=Uloborus diversus TaxID=327109 RepID=UPI002408F975|nr:CDGSH iron-sulfur domain-containing protein 3, mitochondrial-like [Uloborus diversus]
MNFCTSLKIIKLCGLFRNKGLQVADNALTCLYSSRRTPDVSHIPELNEPPLKKYYEAYYQKDKGRVHDKKPFKVKCTKGKIYYWCVCGWSHDQPMCDGKCVLPEMKIKLKPVTFKPKETREYWFCNCKQTKNRPFCDGSHLSEGSTKCSFCN